MGQSSSTVGAPTELNRREFFPSNRFNFRSSAVVPEFESNEEFAEADFLENVVAGLDYTADLPDECLASIFHFLGSGDRKRCSLVCHRWFRVDGQSRHRLSLNAKAEILSFLPSLFARFDSVTKLALRCDRKSISIDDETLVLISLRCPSLTRLKLRGCRELSDRGMELFAQNCKGLKKLSCGSCMFGAGAMNAILDHCTALEELSVKRLRGLHDAADPIGPGAAASSLKSICLKDLINGQCFGPLIIGSKKLRTLKLIRCLGEWDKVLGMLGNFNPGLIEIHLERVHVGDVGLYSISNCSNLEILHIIKTPECTNFGLVCVAERCRLLRKLHIDGWRTNRIGDEGLMAIANQCPNLQELCLIGMNPTSLSLAPIATNCPKLERLALCGSATVGDPEMACIATKCVALKKLCIKGCPISDEGVEALAWGCPSLVKVKVKKCRGVGGEVVERLRERRGSLVVVLDACEIEPLDGSGSEVGVQESGMEFPLIGNQITDASSSFNGRLTTMFRTKFGFFASRNLVACTFRRWSNADDGLNGDS
ncbi:F-box protein SKIP2 [Juglans microcarpa x Juglans regia]|uniref:F-box protein SKIP2 n=1 Tax=Juglans microcarpa x Juglans regia TaxID=2249226 RepID=UPI001B7EC51F|nr:F-box protein SKIP2 [Juglans microcarpa x Juglans regia]